MVMTSTALLDQEQVAWEKTEDLKDHLKHSF